MPKSASEVSKSGIITQTLFASHTQVILLEQNFSFIRKHGRLIIQLVILKAPHSMNCTRLLPSISLILPLNTKKTSTSSSDSCSHPTLILWMSSVQVRLFYSCYLHDIHVFHLKDALQSQLYSRMRTPSFCAPHAQVFYANPRVVGQG